MRKNTKSALLLSVVSIIVCCTMLLGTTMAWFTDSVTSAKNVIVAGNLDVELYHTNAKVKDVEVTGEEDLFFVDKDGNEILWEPGVVAYETFTVKNVGTLALKYALSMNVYDATANAEGKTLEEVIKVAIAETVPATRADVEDLEFTSLSEFEVKSNSYLLPDDETTTDVEGTEDFIVVLYWEPSDADNDYNMNNGETTVLDIEFGVELLATQYTYEKDSFDETYDEDADFVIEVSTADELATALEKGGNILINADITTEKGFLLSDPENDIVLNLNGHTLTATGDRAKLFSVGGDADMTIYGGKIVAQSSNQVINGTGTSTGASTSVYFWSSGNLTMTDVEIEGSVRGGHRAVEVFSGNAVLTNVDITTSYGTGVNVGGNGDPQYAPAYAVLNNCNITVNGMYSSAPYNSVCFSVINGGDLTINSGNYKLINNATYATGDTHGGWVGIVMNSGGTLTINGGTYTNVPADLSKLSNERAVLCAEGASGVTSTLNLIGGTFVPQNTKVCELKNGGVMKGNIVDNGDGTWTAKPKEVSTDTDLAGALENGENVVLTDDIETEAATKAPYGNNAAFVQNGGVLDGNGKTLSVECYGDDYGIMTSGGTIKNLTIDSGCRAIMIMSPTEDVILDNVYVAGDILYPINTGEAGAEGVDLIVSNSTFGGWSSFANIASASFTDCKFIYGEYYDSWPYDSLVKPYIDTVFENCDFAEGYYLDLSALGADCKVTLKSCTVNGNALTAELCGFDCDGTETFCVELPSGRSLADCVIFN